MDDAILPFLLSLVILFRLRNLTNNRELKSHRRARYASWMQFDAYCMAEEKKYPLALQSCVNAELCWKSEQGDVRETAFIA